MSSMLSIKVVKHIWITRLSKDTGPANNIIHNEIFLDIFQTYLIDTKSTCIKNDDVLCVALQQEISSYNK